MKKVGVSWGGQPKTNSAAPSASVIPISEPRVVQDRDYVTYWPQPGETGEQRAGRDKSERLEVLGFAQRKPKLGNLSEGWGERG